MVEYVYQEALYKTLLKKGYNVVKEYNHHPVFDGQPLKSSIQMDMVVFRPHIQKHKSSAIISRIIPSTLSDLSSYPIIRTGEYFLRSNFLLPLRQHIFRQ